MFCSKCGAQNLEQDNFCSKCGESLGSDPAQTAPPQQADVQALYAAAVGYKKTSYHMPYFLRFDQQGVGASWHWPAFFVTTYWLFYRKMWLWGLLYILLPIPFGIVDVAFNSAYQGITGLLYLLAAFVLIPMYANAIYYRHIKKKIADVQAQSPSRKIALQQLQAQGGTSPAVIIVAVILFVFMLPLMGILASIAYPAYQDYMQRAQVSAGLATGAHYQRGFEDYVDKNREWPRSLDELGYKPLADSDNIDEVSITHGGAIIISYRGNTTLDGRSLALVPAKGSNGEITWACENIDLDPSVLPATCR